MNGVPEAAWAYALREVPQTSQLMVTATPEQARRLAAELSCWRPQTTICTFLSSGETPYTRLSAEPRALQSRMGLLTQLALGTQPSVIVTDAQAIGRRLPAPEHIECQCRLLAPGDHVERSQFLKLLQSAGYYAAPRTEEPGTFSARGSVIDLWPPNDPKPSRLDFFGDELESIREIDPGLQRSGAKKDLFALGPARLIEPGPDLAQSSRSKLLELGEQQKLPSESVRQTLDRLSAGIQDPLLQALEPVLLPLRGPLLDWLSKETKVVLCDPEGIDRELDGIDQRFFSGYEKLIDEALASSPESHRVERAELWRRLKSSNPLLITQRSPGETQNINGLDDMVARLRLTPESDEDRLLPLAKQIQRWRREGYLPIMLSPPGRQERLRQRLNGLGLGLRNLATQTVVDWSGCQPQDTSAHLWLGEGRQSTGFVDHQRKRVLLVEHELLGRRRSSQAKAHRKRFRASLDQLNPGDLVVHIDFGIAAYQGLTRRIIDGITMDFLQLNFRGEDKVFVPVERVSVLRRYDGGGRPKLDKIGGTSWQNRRKKVRRGLLEMAHRLAQTQARRQRSRVSPIPHPGSLMEDFDAGFPHELTADQESAVEAIIKDLESAVPMDRLLCGDVGFGKTEVALRASFAAVASGQQVAILCPTTVLCHQHLRTFRNRLGRFGIRVEGVSRLTTSAQLRQIEADLKAGKIEVIIGTHRLLNPQFSYQSLGLLVVDEEQRFGVKHKERLKELKAGVNILTMTATPIPRTLQFALLGLRQLSVIETPPTNRRSVRTALAPYHDHLVQEVIERELHRGGQIFFLHNRVRTLPGIAHHLQGLVPQAKIEVAHGQMKPERLEEAMIRFTDGDVDLLVCTSIIEAGLDIERANTILIDRADHFGLTQLHQIRGRVGRRSERGYCYLLIRKSEAALSDQARERLDALQRFAHLGAGFQVARADLEQRGSGNLLGEDQSGQVAQVGIDLYLDLLAEALAQVQGTGSDLTDRLDLKLGRSAVIPHAFLPDAAERLALYEHIGRLQNDQEIEALEDELTDTYGRLPDEVDALFMAARIRWRAMPMQLAMLQAVRTKSNRWSLMAGFHTETTPIQAQDLVNWVRNSENRCHLTKSGRIVHDPADQEGKDSAELLLGFVNQLKGLLPKGEKSGP